MLSAFRSTVQQLDASIDASMHANDAPLNDADLADILAAANDSDSNHINNNNNNNKNNNKKKSLNDISTTIASTAGTSSDVTVDVVDVVDVVASPSVVATAPVPSSVVVAAAVDSSSSSSTSVSSTAAVAPSANVPAAVVDARSLTQLESKLSAGQNHPSTFFHHMFIFFVLFLDLLVSRERDELKRALESDPSKSSLAESALMQVLFNVDPTMYLL